MFFHMLPKVLPGRGNHPRETFSPHRSGNPHPERGNWSSQPEGAHSLGIISGDRL